MKTSPTERKHLGIIGHPLGHTMSPLMHATAISQLGLAYDYGVFDVTEQMVPPLLTAMKKRNFRGANVTIPYKKTVMPYLDRISEEATVIGAVNTIVNNDGILEGHNTDIVGVYHSLIQVQEYIKGNTVAVFGAGGGARSVIFAVSKFFTPRSVCIINRTVSSAIDLATEFSKIFPTIEYIGTENDENSVKSLDSANLIINTTSVGMKPDWKSHPLPSGFVMRNTSIIFDIVYNPLRTSLITMAENAGARTISGLEMLIGQGDAAFKLFTGKSFPVDRVREKLLASLKREARI